MIVIDADSQFTTKVPVPVEKGDIPDRARMLIEKESFAFGHWVTADHHDTCAVLLRDAKDSAISEIMADIVKVCHEHFANDDPTLVILPADSTAVFLSERIISCFNPRRPGLVIASPAFRAYLDHELILELSNSHRDEVARRDLVNILFLDDSLSSGEMENRVFRAVKKEVKIFKANANINWLTYTVLRRGRRVRAGEAQRERTRSIAPLKGNVNVRYRFAEFAPIGPESMSRTVCPYCEAERKLSVAVEWVAGSRPAIRQLLARALAIVEVRPIGGRGILLKLSTETACELLRLCGRHMPDACVEIWECFFRRGKVVCSSEDALAVVLFVAMHYADVMSYLAVDHILKLFSECAKIADFDSQRVQDAYLLAYTMLPGCTQQELACPLAEVLAFKGNVDIVGAILGLAFASRSQSLSPQTFSLQDGSAQRSIQAARMRMLADTIKEGLSRPVIGPGQQEAIAIQDVIVIDIESLADMSPRRSPEWAARMLSALLHRGDHPSFLSYQIEHLSVQTIETVRTGILEALHLLEMLPNNVVDHLRPQINRLVENMRAVQEYDVQRCRDVAREVLMSLWVADIYPKYFLKPKQLRSRLGARKNDALQELSQTPVEARHIALLGCSDDTLAWEAFGPSAVGLNSHFKNLLVNPFRHYPIERFIPAPLEPPMAIAYLRIDREKRLLQVVVADRARPPDREKLFTRNHGLANVRAMTQLFGGDVCYVRSEGGVETEELKPDSPVCVDSGEVLDCSIFKNVFVTSFPLMLQVF